MRFGTASPRTSARFGIVFRLLETVVLLARRLRSGFCICVLNCVYGAFLDFVECPTVSLRFTVGYYPTPPAGG